MAKKGIAPQKTRRRLTRSEVAETLEHGVITRAFLVLASAAALVGLISLGNEGWLAGQSLVALLIFSAALGHLCMNRREIWSRNSRLLLLFLILLAHLGAAKFCVLQAVSVTHSPGGGQFSPMQRHDMWLLAIPYAFGPMLASVLLGSTVAVFACVFGTLFAVPVFTSVIGDLDFVVRNVTTSLVCGFLCIFLTAEVRKRGDLPRAGLFVGLATWTLAVLFREINILHMWAQGMALNYQSLGWQSAVAIGTPFLMALFIVGGLPCIESLFGITTRVRWLELADLNHPLLRRMTNEAPGTFQHSLAVANLAEAACESIGANPAMARVCSYFHDVGKLVKPEYFTENMRHDRNPHDDLAPTMSALIVTAHVKEGISLALEHKLNQEIIDIIREHHGTSLVFSFYKKALDLQEAARTGGKIASIHDEELPQVSESSFRYGGPKPQSRESAVISLADSVESAARSLDRVTPHKIEQLITDIIRKRIADGQLDDCELRFRDLEKIAESFRHTLSGMMHTRVAYPDDTQTKGRRGSGVTSGVRTRKDASAA